MSGRSKKPYAGRFYGPRPVRLSLPMDVDAYEDRLFGFEAKMKELDNVDDDFRAAERKGAFMTASAALFAPELTTRGHLDKICKHYAKGKCSNMRCPDLHVKAKTTVCKHWLISLCKKNRECEFLHRYDLTKMPTCHFWTEHKECNNGTDCVFLHVDDESTAEDCAAFAQGFCKNGPRCKERHRKKQVCERYLVGFCPDGPSCKFGHPKFGPQ